MLGYKAISVCVDNSPEYHMGIQRKMIIRLNDDMCNGRQTFKDS